MLIWYFKRERDPDKRLVKQKKCAPMEACINGGWVIDRPNLQWSMEYLLGPYLL